MNNTSKNILSKLQDARRSGEILSGARLADELGISRNAVWKSIQSLKEDGIDIRSEQSRGYYLATPVDTLSADSIRTLLRQESVEDSTLEVVVFDSIDSTNNYMKTLPYTDQSVLVTADEQTGGRGRYSRSFSSPKGTGIYLTYAFRPMCRIDEVTNVTTIVAAITHRVLTEISGEHLGIKWVNDIYRDGMKITGILTEALGGLESANFERIIVGIGINCFPFSQDLPDELQGKAGSLVDSAEANFTRNEIIARLAAEMHHAFYRQESLSAADYLDYYRENCFILGHPITVLQNGREPVSAVAESIGENFELHARVQGTGELLTLSGGEVSLRL